jgi:PAS domain S-box-containing protein
MAEIIDFNTGMDLDSVLTAQEISERDEFSRVIIDASLDGIITYDKQVRFTLWSPSMERISGIKSEDVLGRCCYDVFPFVKENGVDVAIQRSLKGEAVRSAPMHFTIPETGASGYTEQQNFPLFNELGEVTGGLAIVRDVTELKLKFDAAVERNRQLEARVRELEEIVFTNKTNTNGKSQVKGD